MPHTRQKRYGTKKNRKERDLELFQIFTPIHDKYEHRKLTKILHA
jgi:hypothetical protein